MLYAVDELVEFNSCTETEISLTKSRARDSFEFAALEVSAISNRNDTVKLPDENPMTFISLTRFLRTFDDRNTSRSVTSITSFVRMKLGEFFRDKSLLYSSELKRIFIWTAFFISHNPVIWFRRKGCRQSQTEKVSRGTHLSFRSKWQSRAFIQNRIPSASAGSPVMLWPDDDEDILERVGSSWAGIEDRIKGPDDDSCFKRWSILVRTGGVRMTGGTADWLDVWGSQVLPSEPLNSKGSSPDLREKIWLRGISFWPVMIPWGPEEPVNTSITHLTLLRTQITYST